MGKWDVPTQEEKEIIQKLGIDPNHCAVSRPGEDQLVILNKGQALRSKRNIYKNARKKEDSQVIGKIAANRGGNMGWRCFRKHTGKHSRRK